jgi:hypothetical protein
LKKRYNNSTKLSLYLRIGINMAYPKLTEEVCLRRLIEKYPTFDFSQFKYINSKTKSTVICDKGHTFLQHFSNLDRGISCNLCGIERRSTSKKDTRESFITKAMSVHGLLYNYEKVVYTGNRVKIEIICKTHGSFWQTPNAHLQGCGCPECSGNVRKAPEISFKEDSTKVHGVRYNYSRFTYKGNKVKGELICSEHGPFWIRPNSHLLGMGCPRCGSIRSANLRRRTLESFVAESDAIHLGRYIYTKVIYVSSHVKCEIICKDHGSFWQTPASHLEGVGCPSCANLVSTPEIEIGDFIKSLGFDIVTNSRTLLGNGKELDIFIPGKNLAIEFNGLWWHGEIHKPKRYHLDKLEAATKAGIRLISIFEDEWISKKEIVKTRLSHILGVSSKTLYARKLDVNYLRSQEASPFFQTTHIQGPTQSSIYIGLYDNAELVACMSFGKSRFEKREGLVELLRFSSIGSVVGGFSRLLKRFLLDNPNIVSVVSYSDKRWSLGEVYSKNGFSKVGSSEPGYFWCKKHTRYGRQSFQKHKLPGALEVFDPAKTEVENCKANGYYRIFDCGMDKWELVWKRK